jgi:hypothetical protein
VGRANDESGVEETKLIGVYSSREGAELAVARTRSLHGFRDYANDFHIDPYELDEDHWTSGFVTM